MYLLVEGLQLYLALKIATVIFMSALIATIIVLFYFNEKI